MEAKSTSEMDEEELVMEDEVTKTCNAVDSSKKESVAEEYKVVDVSKELMMEKQKEADLSKKLTMGEYKVVDVSQLGNMGEKGVEMHTCKECGKKFRCIGNLRVHYRIHKDERPFPCHYCDKAFRTTSHLKKHVATHTGEKPHICSVCGKGFIQKSNLVVHERTHRGGHDQVEKKQKTTSKAAEEPQILINNDLNNDESNSSFQVKDTQDVERWQRFNRTMVEAGGILHYRDEKGQFICSVCTKPFNTSSRLKRHVATHTGEKKYSCELCGKRFVQKGNLDVHMKTHRGNKSIKNGTDTNGMWKDTIHDSLIPKIKLEIEESDVGFLNISNEAVQVKVERVDAEDTEDAFKGEPCDTDNCTLYMSNNNGYDTENSVAVTDERMALSEAMKMVQDYCKDGGAKVQAALEVISSALETFR